MVLESTHTLTGEESSLESMSTEPSERSMRMHARYAMVAIASVLTVIGVFASGVSAEEEGRKSCRTPHQFGEFSDWSEPINLGPVVNSEFNDRHPAISPNGLSLYITSDRPGGF